MGKKINLENCFSYFNYCKYSPICVIQNQTWAETRFHSTIIKGVVSFSIIRYSQCILIRIYSGVIFRKTWAFTSIGRTDGKWRRKLQRWSQIKAQHWQHLKTSIKQKEAEKEGEEWVKGEEGGKTGRHKESRSEEVRKEELFDGSGIWRKGEVKWRQEK